jgi:hypothetical protein
MFKALFDLAIGTIPAEHRTSVWRMFLTLIVGGHILWACGMIPGLDGFARAAEAQENRDAIARIEQSVSCNAIEAEIKRLRSELRDNETKMIEAQQQSNTALIAHLTGVIRDINDLLGDEVAKRTANKCQG